MIPVRTIEFRTVSEGALAGALAFIVSLGEGSMSPDTLFNIVDSFHAKEVPHHQKVVLFENLEKTALPEWVPVNFRKMGYRVAASAKLPNNAPLGFDYYIGIINKPMLVVEFANEYHIKAQGSVQFLPSLLRPTTEIFMEVYGEDPMDTVRRPTDYRWRSLPKSKRTFGVRIYEHDKESST